MNILEINDADLVVYCNAAVAYRAPGAAWLNGDTPVFGTAAREQARLHPRRSHNAYFYRMNTDPLPMGVGVAQTQADLVYLHLLEIVRDAQLAGAPVVVAAPGNYTAEQLGVFLSIAQEADLEVETFVDTAVAASASRAVPGEFYVVDLHQHICTLSHLRVNGEIELVNTQEVPGVGFGSLLDGWVNVIADQFVTETRFDPLHVADTEQQLYDQMQPLANGTVAAANSIDLISDGHTRHIELGPNVLTDKAATRLQPVLDLLPSASNVVLTHRSALPQGVQSAIQAAGHTITTLEPDALPRGCGLNESLLQKSSGNVRRVQRLPATSVVDSRPTAARIQPTHVLYQHHAHRLPRGFDDIAFDVGNGGVSIASHAPGLSISINAQPLSGAEPLGVGDTVRAGDSDYTLIVVSD